MEVIHRVKQFYNRHEILRNFAAVLSVDVLVKASSFLLLPLYLKLMQQEEYGLYNYLISIISLLTSLLLLGVNVAQSKIYFDSEEESYKSKVLVNIHFVLFTVLTFLLLLALLFKWDILLYEFLFFNNPFDYQSVRAYVFPASFVGVYGVMIFNYLVIEKRIKEVQWFNLLRLICANGLAVGAMYVYHNGTAIFRLQFTYGTELLLIVFFGWFMFRHIKLVSIDLTIILKILKISVPITLAAIPYLITMFVDKVFLERNGDFIDLSLYYLAFSLASVIGIIAESLKNVWMPDMFKEKDPLKSLSRTNRLLGVMFVIFIGIGVFVYFTILLTFHWGVIESKYYDATPLLPFLFLAQIFRVMTLFYALHLISLGKVHYHTLINYIMLLPAIGVNWFLIQEYHVIGAVIANLSVSFLTILIYWLMVTYSAKRIVVK